MTADGVATRRSAAVQPLPRANAYDTDRGVVIADPTASLAWIESDLYFEGHR
jgi:hypothetical protein